MMIKQVMPPAAIDVEYEEMKWALNMTLIGDMHWKSLTSVDDIKSIVLRMDRKVNFKVNRLNTNSGKKIKELILLFFYRTNQITAINYTIHELVCCKNV